jgi:hypothetical protein
MLKRESSAGLDKEISNMNQRKQIGKQPATRGASARNSQPDANEDDLTDSRCKFCEEFLTVDEVEDEETFCRWCRAKYLDIVFGPGV